MDTPSHSLDDLVIALSKQTPEINIEHRKAREQNDIGYDPIFDSDYRLSTGEWLESVCGDEECEFCGKRPLKHC